MHVLTATSRTQGQRLNDYTHAVEGELVRIDEPCARDRDDPDGGCGCGRGFSGMSSSRATTTVMVRDLPMTAAEYARAYADSLVSDGWLSANELTDETVAESLRAEVDQLLAIAASWPAGTVVERRLDVLQERVVPMERPRAS